MAPKADRCDELESLGALETIAIKHDHKSKNPTTRWSDIIKLK